MPEKNDTKMTNHGLPPKFKPMKCYTGQPSDLHYPALASPKVDGFRCIVSPDGVALSASLKPIPNEFVQDYFKQHKDILAMLDGELTVGPPNAHDVFEQTSGALRRKHGEPDFTFHVFDMVDTEYPYASRHISICGIKLPSRCVLLKQWQVVNPNELEGLSIELLNQGYEGTIARHIGSPYKFGRATLKSGQMIKIKPFEDDEAEILELIEGMHNTNEGKINQTGNTERSSCKDGLAPAKTLGSFRVKVLTGRFAGVEAVIATGSLTADQRRAIWLNKLMVPNFMVGETFTFKHMLGSGTYEKPRHATFLRFRPEFDCGN